jgi:hypothetical protein
VGSARTALAHGSAALLYLTLAIALTWPLAWHLHTVVPHDLGDPLLVTYLLNWNATVTPLSERWWSPPIFWPAPDTMTLSEHLLGLSIITIPLQRAGLSPLAVYNVLFIGSFWAAGFSAYLFGRVITGNTIAGLVSGLVFMFAPYRASQMAHLQVLMAPGVPLLFAALHKSLSGGWTWPAIAVIAWLWQGLVTGYYLLFLPIVILIWLLWFAPRDRGLWMRLGIAGALASLSIAPLLLRYATAHAAGGYHREFGEVVDLAADVNALWQAAPALAFWSRLLPAGSMLEEQLFPGLATLTLVLIALSTIPRVRGKFNRSTLAFLGLAVLLAAVAVVAAMFPGEHVIGGFGMSLTNPHKQFGLAITSLILAALTTRTVRAAWNAQSLTAGYLLIAVLTWILAMGPMPHAYGVPVWYAAPYWLLFSYVPGFDELRVPARLWMITIAALAALAAIAVAHVHARPRPMRLLIPLLALVAIAEGWIGWLPLRPAPAPLAIPPQAVAVLEVPANEPMRDASAMYRSLSHGRPVLNGWSGYTPEAYRRLIAGLETEDVGVLQEALSYGPVALVIDPSGPYHERYLRLAQARAAPCERQASHIVCLLQ